MSRVKSVLTRDTGHISAARIKHQIENLIVRDAGRSSGIKWQTPRDPGRSSMDQVVD